MYKNYKKTKQEYQRKIEEKIIEYKEEGNIEENWKRTENAIKKVADEAVGKEEKQHNKEWFNEECAKVISEKNNARIRILQTEYARQKKWEE
jgi:hypothetical protein